MLFLFFLILLGLAGVGGYYLINKYEQTIASLKVKLNLLNNEMTKRLSDMPSLNLDNFMINFLDAENTTGHIKSDTHLYLFPAAISPILYTTHDDMNADIIFKASVSNSMWYFISLSVNNNINSKGWISSSSISIASLPDSKTE